MELANSKLVPASRAVTWKALLDPQVLKACIPGCEEIESTGENSYRLVMRAKVGPVSARFTGSLQLSDLDEPNRYSVSFQGQAGAMGFGKGTAQVALAPVAEGTELSYSVQASVGGKIAQVGSRLIDSAALMIADDFFNRFIQHLREQEAVAAPEVEAGPAAALAGEPALARGSLAATRATRWIPYVAAGVVLILVSIVVLTR